MEGSLTRFVVAVAAAVVAAVVAATIYCSCRSCRQYKRLSISPFKILPATTATTVNRNGNYSGYYSGCYGNYKPRKASFKIMALMQGNESQRNSNMCGQLGTAHQTAFSNRANWGVRLRFHSIQSGRLGRLGVGWPARLLHDDMPPHACLSQASNSPLRQWTQTSIGRTLHSVTNGNSKGKSGASLSQENKPHHMRKATWPQCISGGHLRQTCFKCLVVNVDRGWGS